MENATHYQVEVRDQWTWRILGVSHNGFLNLKSFVNVNPDEMTHALQINLLGSIEIQSGRQRLTTRLGRKTQALLAYLIASGQAHRRRALHGIFCAEADDPAAALRWHLSRIRRALGAEVLLAEEDTIRFNRRGTRVDSAEFERVLDANLAWQKLETLTAALELYRGELLEDLALPDAPEFELWLLGQRARLCSLYERGLGEAIARFIAREQYEPAIHWAQRLLQSNPLLEQGHARLIWLYAQTGQRQAALQQFERCRELLRRELAVEPTAELMALYAAVLSGKLGAAVSVRAPRVTALEEPAVRFVGREAELTQLYQIWQAARDRPGRVLLIEAEAGGGKTRLIHEFARRVPDALFLYGQCNESAQALPYRPWIELLETRLAALNDDALDQLPAFWLDHLARVLPALAARLPRAPTASGSPTGQELETLFAAVTEFLFRLPRTPPLLICVDDLQWADESSLQLFHFVARRLSRRDASLNAPPTLLVGTLRGEETQDNPALQTLLADLQRTCTRLSLPPLAPESIAALISQLWPELPPGDRPRSGAVLTQATGGNPLFVIEVLRELAHTPEIPAVLPVPGTIRELIHRRLSKSPESARQVIEAIAVLGAPTSLSQAQQVSGRSEAETAAAIDSGLRQGLLQVLAAAAPTSYDFSHALTRQAVVSQLQDARHRLLHRRAAMLLAQIAGRLPSTQRQELIGRITRHAVKGEAFPLILAWAPRAADYAKRLGAYKDALAAYDQALDALEQLARASGPSDADAHRGLALLLGKIEMLHRLGRWPEEETLLETAANWLVEAPDARLQAALFLRQAAYLNAISDYARAFEFAQRAHASYTRLSDASGAAASLYVAGTIKLGMGQNKAARELLEQSLALYRSAGDLVGESHCLGELAWCATDLGDIETALAYAAHARQIAEQQGNVPAQAFACFMLAYAWNIFYAVEKVRPLAEQARRLYRELSSDTFAARAAILLAASYVSERQWAQAQTLFDQVFADAQASRNVWLEGWAAQMLGRLALINGNIDSAAHWIEHAYRLRREHGEVQNEISDLAWMGRVRLAQAKPAEALNYTAEALERLEALRGQVYVYETPDIFLCHAEALAATDRRAESAAYIQRAYDALLQFAEQIRDPHVRSGFLSAPINARILAAHSSGQIRPFPLSLPLGSQGKPKTL